MDRYVPSNYLLVLKNSKWGHSDSPPVNKALVLHEADPGSVATITWCGPMIMINELRAKK